MVGASAGYRDWRLCRLPVIDEVKVEADRRGVELVAVPTSEACDLLTREGGAGTTAILHVTC